MAGQDSAASAGSDLNEADAAWASFESICPPATASALLADPRRFLRVNPCIEYREIARLADGAWHLAGHNESNAREIDTVGEFVSLADGDGWLLRYRSGCKQETRIQFSALAGGARVTLTEVYRGGGEGIRPDAGDADRSLVPWVAALRKYLHRQWRWRWLPGLGLLTDFWFGMPPRQRRTAWLIVWTTVLEFLVFAGLVAIFAVAQ